MKKGFMEAIEGRRGEIKRKWELLLRAAPATTPLGNPDALVYLMDESLDQLFTLFHGRTSHPCSRAHLAAKGLGTDCHCRLNPLINYFISGQTALGFAAQEIPRSELRLDDVTTTACIDELIVVFRLLAHREIRAFCEICQYSPMNARAAGIDGKSVCPLTPADLGRN